MRSPDRLPNRGKALLPRVLFGLTTLLCSACFSAGEGLDPPRERIYFPVGLALTGDSRFLVVANSDYDLQFNAGTLQVFDVERTLALALKPCASDADCHEEGTGCDPGSQLCAPRVDDGGFGSPCGEQAERELSERLLYPGRCEYIRADRPPSGESLLTSSVEIGAFATDVVYRQPAVQGAEADPGRPGRVFLPVRGDATLHWADIDENGAIDCGQHLNGGSCDDTHRAGDDPDLENARDVRLAPEPFAIGADPAGEVIVVSHQTREDVSLFVNDWAPGQGAHIEYTLGGLGRRPVGVASLPPPRTAAKTHPPGFLVTFRAAPQVDLVRYYSDLGSTPERPFLARTGVSPIQVNSSGVDSRGIAVDPARRTAAEQQCLDLVGTTLPCVWEWRDAPEAGEARLCTTDVSAADQARVEACLQLATATPVDVFVANRSPASLLIGRTQPAVNAVSSTELPTFYDSVPLAASPSRVAVGDVCVGGSETETQTERRVFVVSDDSSRIAVYDPERRRIETEIATGPGPHAIAVDSKNCVLYVAHFLDSFIGVVSLNRRFPRTYGVTLATIGEPTPPRASK